MSPSEWAAHLQAHAQKQARTHAWQARLHGLKHKSGRALTTDDFLPTRPAKPVPPRQFYDQLRAALG